MKREPELVAVTTADNMVAVAGLWGVSIVDLRSGPIGSRIREGKLKAPRNMTGIRSVEIRDNILSFGTGNGSIVFYDVRCGARALSELGVVGTDSDMYKGSLGNGGTGYTEENERYRHYFPGGMLCNPACYAHKWNPTGTSIFSCGGPLMHGLKGNYVTLWT